MLRPRPLQVRRPLPPVRPAQPRRQALHRRASGASSHRPSPPRLPCGGRTLALNGVPSLHHRPSVLTTSGEAPAAKRAVAPPILSRGTRGVARAERGAAHVRAVEACRRTIEHGDMHSSVTGWNMKRTLCLNRLAGEFGRMPLVHSRCNIALNASQLYEGS